LLRTLYEEFQAFLQKVNQAEQGNTAACTTSIFENEDFSSVSESISLGDVDSLEAESSDLLGIQADSYSAKPTTGSLDKETDSYEANYLRTDK
jgi:hypothetical protein